MNEGKKSEMEEYFAKGAREAFGRLVKDMVVVQELGYSLGSSFIRICASQDTVLLALGDMREKNPLMYLYRDYLISRFDEVVKNEGITLPNLLISRLSTKVGMLGNSGTKADAFEHLGVLSLHAQKGYFTFASEGVHVMEINENGYKIYQSQSDELPKSRNRVKTIMLIPCNSRSSYYLFTNGVIHLLEEGNEEEGLKHLVSLLTDIRNMPLPLQKKEIERCITEHLDGQVPMENLLLIGLQVRDSKNQLQNGRLLQQS